MNKSEKNKITNRILINFLVGICSYIVLYLIYALTMGGLGSYKYVTYRIPAVYALLIVFVVAAIILYVLSAKKNKKFKNYAHMFVGLAAGAFLLNLSPITAAVFKLFGARDVFFSLYQSNAIFANIMNTQKMIIAVAILGVIYLVGMFIYNLCIMNRKSTK